jgi:hypothetical protein
VADAPDRFWRPRFLATSYAHVLTVRGTQDNHRRAAGQAVAEPDPGLHRLQRWFGQLLDLTLTTEQEFRRELVGEYRRVAPPQVRAWHRQARAGPAARPRRPPGPRGPLPLGGNRAGALVGRRRAVRPDGPPVWAYCGHGQAGRRRYRLMTADELPALGQPDAKHVVRWMATGCVRQVEAEYRTPQGVRARRPASAYRTVSVARRSKSRWPPGRSDGGTPRPGTRAALGLARRRRSIGGVPVRRRRRQAAARQKAASSRRITGCWRSAPATAAASG